jgi:hypothetical protein
MNKTKKSLLFVVLLRGNRYGDIWVTSQKYLSLLFLARQPLIVFLHGLQFDHLQ